MTAGPFARYALLYRRHGYAPVPVRPYVVVLAGSARPVTSSTAGATPGSAGRAAAPAVSNVADQAWSRRTKAVSTASRASRRCG